VCLGNSLNAPPKAVAQACADRCGRRCPLAVSNHWLARRESTRWAGSTSPNGPHGGPDLIYYKEYAELLYLMSGIEIPESEFDTIGERIVNVERAFNAREGFGRKDDTVPPRMREPARGGYNEGAFYSQEMLDVMLDGYYELHKWDKKTGIPTPERLNELDLPVLAEQIAKIQDPSSTP
jgi:hypothetical protein